MKDDFAAELSRNFSPLDDKGAVSSLESGRSLARPYGLYRYLHYVESGEAGSGYLLSNRTYEKDERAQWIVDRNQVMEMIRQGE